VSWLRVDALLAGEPGARVPGVRPLCEADLGTAGTIFADTRTPLTRWFGAAWNLAAAYTYASDNPISLADPLGLWPSWKTIANIAIAVAVVVAGTGGVGAAAFGAVVETSAFLASGTTAAIATVDSTGDALDYGDARVGLDELKTRLDLVHDRN
jgi:hypothetical protein